MSQSREPADLPVIPADGLPTTSFLHLPLASTDELLITFFAPKHQGDEAVWAEDEPVVLEDITDPDVRDKVRSIAAEQKARLELRLLAAGQHITQR
ncbi:hypothetical protein OG598_25025 [Micromonospora sp. NBC_00330]|uniref:hypothetical protein n=1 Tax=Micromonospora sp. NBC_00330 TaxID=2903585 RepID=UPI002E2CF405|nr:hypothetical protein [Micromonospora sp. NBC_00330]